MNTFSLLLSEYFIYSNFNFICGDKYLLFYPRTVIYIYSVTTLYKHIVLFIFNNLNALSHFTALT